MRYLKEAPLGSVFISNICGSESLGVQNSSVNSVRNGDSDRWLAVIGCPRQSSTRSHSLSERHRPCQECDVSGRCGRQPDSLHSFGAGNRVEPAPAARSGRQKWGWGKRQKVREIQKVFPMPFCHSAILPFCHSAIPPFRHSAIPPFCHSAIPPFRHSAIPPFCHSVVLPFCRIVFHMFRIRVS